MINNYILAVLPKWKLNNEPPVIVPLLNLIKIMFDFGLITIDFCDELIRELYLISENIVALEKIISESNI